MIKNYFHKMSGNRRVKDLIKAKYKKQNSFKKHNNKHFIGRKN